MFELDQIMNMLIIRKHGKGITKEGNAFHWMAPAPTNKSFGIVRAMQGDIICLYCGELITNGIEGSDDHALVHIKEHNLTAFI